VDEVFMDVTHYLKTYGMTAGELARRMIGDVLADTGITATAGIGTNLYLCKVAMDIVAKHMEADENGVRIAMLDEMSYRRLLWSHTPITDFWRVGRGYADKLADYGMHTMGDVARCSVGEAGDFYNEDLLYRLFGVNAELLIDHAWGWEPCTIEQVKAYRPENNSLSSGQVLQCPYDYQKARLIVWEMTDLLVLDLVDKGLVADQMVLTLGYDIENLNTPEKLRHYKGQVTTDRYGRKVPKHAHGTVNLGRRTSSTKLILDAVLGLYDRIVNPDLLVRRVTVVANHVTREAEGDAKKEFVQYDLFTDYEELERQEKAEKAALDKERRMQQAVLSIKKRYGKNAILKGSNLSEGATTIERNSQIGGHRK
jgi:DNA polymerase V